MGYDITFHPISEAQMDAWYFSLLDSLAKGGYVPAGGGGGRSGDGSVLHK